MCREFEDGGGEVTQISLVAIFDIHAPVSAISIQAKVFPIHLAEVKYFKQDIVGNTPIAVVCLRLSSMPHGLNICCSY
jgi:hypothetical protein